MIRVGRYSVNRPLYLQNYFEYNYMHFPIGRWLLLVSCSSQPASPMNIPVKYTVSELFTGFPFCPCQNYTGTLWVVNLHVRRRELSSQGRKAWHAFRGIPWSLKFRPTIISQNGLCRTLLKSSFTGTCTTSGSATYHRLSDNCAG